MPTLTVKIDPSLCIAAANCTGIAPKLFQIDDSGIAEILQNGVPKGYEHTLEVSDAEMELIEEAIVSCPTQAITKSGD